MEADDGVLGRSRFTRGRNDFLRVGRSEGDKLDERKVSSSLGNHLQSTHLVTVSKYFLGLWPKRDCGQFTLKWAMISYVACRRHSGRI